MKAVKPIIHGRDHLPDGADPIALLPPIGGGFVDQVTSHPDLVHYWRMGAAAGNQPDTAPLYAPVDATPVVTGAAGTYDVTGALSVDEDDGAFQFNGMATVDGDWFSAGPSGAHRAKFLGNSPFTVECWAWIDPAFNDSGPGGAILAGGLVAVSAGGSDGWALQMTSNVGVDGHRFLFRRGSDDVYPILGVSGGVWHHVVATYDGATSRLYVDGVLFFSEASTDSIGATVQPVRIGFVPSIPYNRFFPGMIDEVALYKIALDPDTIKRHYDGGIDPAAGGDAGNVLTVDENGNPVWAPPAVEVSGGGLDDTTPDPTPVDSDSGPYAGTPTTGTGWHLEAHTEIVFLVDATRGRFDVPTMKWTRVPFNTIRILRTWEPEVDSDVVKTAWLPDDRGLTGPAKDGVLHVNADMAWSGDQLVQGWVAIEYPVLDPHGLPDDDPEIPGFGPRPEAPTPGLAAEDSYMRALRPFNLSTGSPLHMPSSGDPAFITWHFWDEAHVMEEGGYPPPTYPIWPARPMHLPPPYPQLSPTDSKGYYVDSVGNPGWMFDKLSVATTLSAGANLCLQAWQDSPWLIRFSTDRFPAFHGYTGTYRGYPYLYLSFAYDPDTIDHTTGKLLLPAP